MIRTPLEFHKLEYLLKDDIPTQSEVRLRMGAPLAQVFFDYCRPETRRLLGIIPPLKGPLQELWISPSDQLIGKASLTPPLSNNYIKACTHQGILALGESALEKYKVELRREMKTTLEEEMGEKRNMIEAQKRRLVTLTEQKMRLYYENYIRTLEKEFEGKLKNDLSEAIARCNKAMQKAIVKQRMELTQEMLKKLRKEICYVVESLYDDFERSIHAQRENMIADFNEIMRKMRSKVDVELKELERQKTEALRIQRHELETQNVTEVTHLLCLERMRSSSEKHAMHLCFEKQIQALQDLLVEASEVGSLIKKGAEEKTKDDDSSDAKIRDIVQEFQKFINFAFGAVPGQAEFLLSLESLLFLELDEKIRNVKEKHMLPKDRMLVPEVKPAFEVVEIIDKEGRKWRPIQLIPDLPHLYCTKDELLSPIVKSEINFHPRDDYTDAASICSAKTLNSYESLPFCTFENTLYVRSDYREGDANGEKRMFTELAEGSRFIMELKKPKPCNPQLIRGIEVDVTLGNKKLQPSIVAKAKDSESSILNRSNKCSAYQNVSATQGLSNQFSNGKIISKRWDETKGTNEKNKTLGNVMSHVRMAKTVDVEDSNGTKIFKVVGEDGVEHLQTAKEFTCARMHSLMRIFHFHPSLKNMLIPKIGQALY